MTDLPQILIGELGKTKEMFLALFKDSKWSRLSFFFKFSAKAGFPS